MLLFLAELFENVVGADFHNRDFLIEARLLTTFVCAEAVFTDLSVATSWHGRGMDLHVLGSSQRVILETTMNMSQRLVLPVWIPFIVCLDMSVGLVPGVIQVTVNPVELRNVTEEPWVLRDLSWAILVPCADWIQFLVRVGVNDLVSKIVMGLLPVVFGEVGVVVDQHDD